MTNAKISLLMPTRNRYKIASKFIKSLELTTNSPKLMELLIYIDKDDSESKKLTSKIITIKKFVGEKLTMGGYNTFLYKKSIGDIIMLVNDDSAVLTQSWDKLIIENHEKYDDQIYLAYPNDLNKKNLLSTFPILSRLTCEKIKRPFPEEYKGAFIDLHLFDIFKRLETFKLKRIIYLNEIIFEHLHYRIGKSKVDNTYLERNRFEDDNTFHNLIQFRQEQAIRLIDRHSKEPKIDLEKLNKNNDISKINRIKIVIRYLASYELPFKWRLYLTTYFLTRNIYKAIFNQK